MKNYFFCLIGVALLLLQNRAVFAQGDWKLEKDADGIAVYTKMRENSNFKELKAVTNFKTSLTSLIALLSDVPSQQIWMYKCKEARILKTINSSELYYYSLTKTPWPLNYRDVVVHFKVVQDPKTKVTVVTSENTPGFLPEIPTYVRTPYLSSTWVFTPKPNGTVDGTYHLKLNPGGVIPAWILNLAIVEGPYTTVVKMKEVVKNPKYQLAKINCLFE